MAELANPIFARLLSLSVAMVCIFSGCDRATSNRTQGYIEGEFVYVASPSAGQVETLNVGAAAKMVKAGDPLFAMECGLKPPLPAIRRPVSRSMWHRPIWKTRCEKGKTAAE